MSEVIATKKEFRDNPSTVFPIQYVKGEAEVGVRTWFRLTISFPATKQEEITTLLRSATISFHMINETSLHITSNAMEYAILYNALTVLQNSELINPSFAQDIIQNFPTPFGRTFDLSQPDYREQQENLSRAVRSERGHRSLRWINDDRGFGFIRESSLLDRLPPILEFPTRETNTSNSSSQNPETNERQITLESLQADEMDPSDEFYEHLQKLYDPVTLEAIQHPCKLKNDTTHQYFEFHSLMALARAPQGLFAHPLTKQIFRDDDIQNCAEEYATLFDEVTEKLRSKRENRPTP